MPIRVFSPHYQLVYANSYTSSFSLISYRALEYNIQFTCLTNNYYYICIVQIAQLRCLTDSFK